MKHPYSTDLTDAQWALVEPLLPPQRPRGRRPLISRRRVLDAIFYQAKNGCTWRDLPRDFPAWQTVYAYFKRWRDDGTLAHIYHTLHGRWRSEIGREFAPSAGSIDSQSVQAAPEAAERGSDPKKKVKGRKRHLCVDTEGFPMSVAVTVASANDKKAAYGLIEEAARRSPRLSRLWADTAYRSGPLAAHSAAYGVSLEVSGGQHLPPRGGTKRATRAGFQVAPRRWVVERTFAWLKRHRRLVHDFERLASTVEAFIYLAMTRILLNRLAPHS